MFTFTSTRRCPPATNACNTAALQAVPVREDLATQASNAALHKTACMRETNETLSTATGALATTQEAAKFSLKSLMQEAARHDLSKVRKDDAHSRIVVKAGWSALIGKMEERLARGGLAVATELLDTISVLGVWFPDAPSPAYGRRPQAILDMYYRYLAGTDISDEIRGFDFLARLDTGRRMSASSFSSSADADEQHAAKFHSFAVAPPEFEQTPFIAQSRELRQLVVMRRIQNGDLVFAKTADEEQQQEQQEQQQQNKFIDLIQLIPEEDEDVSVQQQQEDENDVMSSPTTTTSTSTADSGDDDDLVITSAAQECNASPASPLDATTSVSSGGCNSDGIISTATTTTHSNKNQHQVFHESSTSSQQKQQQQTSSSSSSSSSCHHHSHQQAPRRLSPQKLCQVRAALIQQQNPSQSSKRASHHHRRGHHLRAQRNRGAHSHPVSPLVAA